MVYKYFPTPIRTICKEHSEHDLYIESDKDYVFTDPVSKFSSTASQDFYDMCIQSKDFNKDSSKLVLKPIAQSCLPNLLYASQNQTFKYGGNCNVKVLGRNINEAYIYSKSVTFLYVGFDHKIHITCNNFESLLQLDKGSFRIPLTDAYSYGFASETYLFTLHFSFTFNFQCNLFTKTKNLKPIILGDGSNCEYIFEMFVRNVGLMAL